TQLTMGSERGARRLTAIVATASYFPLLGVRPAIGRFFLQDEDRLPQGEYVVVLSDAFWKNQFGGDPAVLAEDLRIGRYRYRIIGVAPEGFTGAELKPADVWIPISAAASGMVGDTWETNNSHWIRIIARVSQTGSTSSVEAHLNRVYRQAQSLDSDRQITTSISLGSILPERGPEKSADTKVTIWLACVSAIVMLVACANVANLLLAQAIGRRRELAIRVALGGNRSRIVRQLLTESLLLALVGALGAVLVTLWLGGVVRAYLLPNVHFANGPIDIRVVLFSSALAVFTGLACGVAPALKASRIDVTAFLASGERAGLLQRGSISQLLVVAQVSLTFVLLVGTGLFVRSLQNVYALDLGVDARNVLVASFDRLEDSGYSPAEIDALYRRALHNIIRLPGVERASLSLTAPFWGAVGMWIVVPGRPLPRLSTGGPYANAVSPEFFATAGMSIIAGRGFTPGDQIGSEKVVVLGATLARLLWPQQDPIGECVKLGDPVAPCRRVVGVAEDARRFKLVEDSTMLLYLPLDQWDRGYSERTILIRTDSPRALAPAVRRELQGLAIDLPFADVRPIDEILDPQTRHWRLGTTLFGLFGVVALFLAVTGLVGVITYSVKRSARELAIRSAVGATSLGLLWLVFSKAMRLALMGVALGAVCAALGGRVVVSLLFGIEPDDLVVYSTVSFTLLTIVGLASLAPAWRASRVDPAAILRSS
nr:ABC transporter permease [Pyrinomonadaceae bacterium]